MNSLGANMLTLLQDKFCHYTIWPGCVRPRLCLRLSAPPRDVRGYVLARRGVARLLDVSQTFTNKQILSCQTCSTSQFVSLNYESDPAAWNPDHSCAALMRSGGKNRLRRAHLPVLSWAGCCDSCVVKRSIMNERCGGVDRRTRSASRCAFWT